MPTSGPGTGCSTSVISRLHQGWPTLSSLSFKFCAAMLRQRGCNQDKNTWGNVRQIGGNARGRQASGLCSEEQYPIAFAAGIFPRRREGSGGGVCKGIRANFLVHAGSWIEPLGVSGLL